MIILIIFIVGLFFSTTTFGQKQRVLKTATFYGSGYELGLQHGKYFKKEISEIVTKFNENLSSHLLSTKNTKKADEVLKRFLDYAGFTESIKKWTPDLYDEVRGIANGSEQTFNSIFVINLLDEFWVYLANPKYHHCSDVGVPSINSNPSYIAQNMDIENYTDGYQTLIRVKGNEIRPEQLVLTHPGLIALNGMNENGIGVCVNTIMQLKPSSQGLPVAFVVRKLICLTEKNEILDFIQSVNHASGQNYILGVRGEAFDYEASANKVVQFKPKNNNGTVYHTNHPIVNDDINDELDWASNYNPNLPTKSKPLNSNSYIRLNALSNRMTSQLIIGDEIIKDALRSKDDDKHPVCREPKDTGSSFTFASTIMTLTGDPYLQITAGPPSESDYKKFNFKSN